MKALAAENRSMRKNPLKRWEELLEADVAPALLQQLNPLLRSGALIGLLFKCQNQENNREGMLLAFGQFADLIKRTRKKVLTTDKEFHSALLNLEKKLVKCALKYHECFFKLVKQHYRSPEQFEQLLKGLCVTRSPKIEEIVDSLIQTEGLMSKTLQCVGPVLTLFWEDIKLPLVQLRVGREMLAGWGLSTHVNRKACLEALFPKDLASYESFIAKAIADECDRYLFLLCERFGPAGIERVLCRLLPTHTQGELAHNARTYGYNLYDKKPQTVFHEMLFRHVVERFGFCGNQAVALLAGTMPPQFNVAFQIVMENRHACERLLHWRDKKGYTALHLACWNHQLKRIKLMVTSRFAQELAMALGSDEHTPLHLFCGAVKNNTHDDDMWSHVLLLLLKASSPDAMLAQTKSDHLTPMQCLVKSWNKPRIIISRMRVLWKAAKKAAREARDNHYVLILCLRKHKHTLPEKPRFHVYINSFVKRITSMIRKEILELAHKHVEEKMVDHYGMPSRKYCFSDADLESLKAVLDE